MRKRISALAAAVLCVSLSLSAGLGEGGGAGETGFREDLYDGGMGFTFLYAGEYLEAYPGERDGITGTIVETPNGDDYMALSLIDCEEAEAVAPGVTEAAEGSRRTADVYWEPDEGTVRFCAVVAENGQYLRAAGEYAEEREFTSGTYFRRILETASFAPSLAVTAEWGDPEGVVLTAVRPVTGLRLIALDWTEGDGFFCAARDARALGDAQAGTKITVAAEFIGDMPSNGVAYTDGEGTERFYALDISGEDGRLILWDLEGYLVR